MRKYRRGLWVCAALLLGVLLLVTLALLLPLSPPPPAPYERVQNGMSRAEVEAFLGPSTAQAYDASLKPLDGRPLANSGLAAEQWEDGESTIHVDYDARTGRGPTP